MSKLESEKDRIVGETSQFTMPAPPLAMHMGTQLMV